MILYTKHIQGPVLIHADDTDVLVLLLSGSNVLGDVYMKTGRGSKGRIPLPGGHGWEIAEGEITVKWLNSKPAPKQILEFLSFVLARNLV